MHRLDMEMSRMRNMRSDDSSEPPTEGGHEVFHTDHTRPKNLLKPLAMCAGIAFLLLVGLLIVVLIMAQLRPHLSSDGIDSSAQTSPLTGTVRDRIETKDGDFICSSRECLRAGLTILDKMDSSVDPCDDFYSYACGGFVKDTKIPDDKLAVNTFTVAIDRMREQLLSVLGEEIDENELAPFKVAKNLYQVCMNEISARIDEQSLQPLWNILESVGGWPVLWGDDWNADGSWSWVQSMKELRMRGYSTDHFFDVSVRADLENPTRRIIHVDQATLNISHEDLVEGLSDPTVEANYTNMVNMDKELQDSLNFERSLARISVPISTQRHASSMYNPMTVKQLQSKYSYIDWVDYLNAMFNGTDIVIDENERIIVRAPSYMEKLGPLLGETSNRVLANYVMGRVVSYSLPFLTERLQREQPQFSTFLSRKHEQEHSSKECLETTLKRFPTSVGALYVRKYFSNDSRQAALDMVNEIKSAFVDILEKVNWMDKITKKSALEKMDSMIFNIGYPDELMDDNAIIEFYKGLEFKPDDSYLDAVLNVDRFETTRTFKRLRQAVNRTEWSTHARPSVFNSRYFPVENSIQIPATILQAPLFSFRLPKYLNYGSIGPIIGREITHGVDLVGMKYDKSGNSADWWQTIAKLGYVTKADCMINQYGNYTDPDVNMTLDGATTQIDNIADHSGLKQSYYAYKKWAVKNDPEPRLPGLDLTSEQMFWLSAAQTWCSVLRPEALAKRIAAGDRVPGRFRVLGPMSNMVEFSKDFNCPAGAPMNPTTKCEVW